MDINAPDFMERFKLEDGIVGIIGQGFVGGAMRAYFERKVKVLAYDKYKTGYDTLDDVVSKSDIVFVCVPTPMRLPSGECHTGIVTACLNDIVEATARVGRPGDTFVVVLKSTVPPGFTKEMQRQFPTLRITFSPEFLTEANAVQDMIQANRVVVGGDEEDAGVVLKFFLEVDRRRVDEGKCVLAYCDSTVAEMAKLFTNCILFTKVLFANEVYQLSQKLGINYEEVRAVSCLDPRIGTSHTMVPGPDGDMGAGGHCFPKDMHNLKFVAAQFGVPEKLFTAVLSRNEELRTKKDWLAMAGRAVIPSK
jgi:UDPglucose 6-dehydrogenase